jgi:hypothetical protein
MLDFSLTSGRMDDQFLWSKSIEIIGLEEAFLLIMGGNRMMIKLHISGE